MNCVFTQELTQNFRMARSTQILSYVMQQDLLWWRLHHISYHVTCNHEQKKFLLPNAKLFYLPNMRFLESPKKTPRASTKTILQSVRCFAELTCFHEEFFLFAMSTLIVTHPVNPCWTMKSFQSVQLCCDFSVWTTGATGLLTAPSFHCHHLHWVTGGCSRSPLTTDNFDRQLIDRLSKPLMD